MHTPQIKVLQIPTDHLNLDNQMAEVGLKVDKQSLLVIIQSLELSAAEQQRVSFIPCSKEALVQWKIAQAIKGGIEEALRGARR